MNYKKLSSLLLPALLLCVPAIAQAQPDSGDMVFDESEPEAAEEPAAEPEETPEPAAESTAGPGMDVDAALETEAPTSEPDDAAEPWLIGIAPRLGLTVPTSKLGLWPNFGMELDVALAMDGKLLAAVDLSYTRPGRDASTSDTRVGGDVDYTIDESEFAIGIGGVYRLFDRSKTLIPWFGAGLAIQMLKSTETTSIAPGKNTSQDTRFGFELSAGADFAAGPGYLFGELRGIYTDLNHMLTGNSNAGNVMLSLGYRVVF